MKICIDGIGASWLKGTGLYTYTFELLENLFELYPQPQYKIIWDNHNSIATWKESASIEFIDPEINRKKNDYSRLDKYIRDNIINIFHSPNNGLSITQDKNTKNIITVHDLLPNTNPEYADNKYMKKFNTIFSNSINKAEKVIAVSENIRSQVLDGYSVDENRVVIIYPGCSRHFKQLKKDDYSEILKDKYNIEGEYILYAGSIHIRKNFNLLFKAFKRVLKHRNNIRLVIAGKVDGKREEYFDMLDKSSQKIGIHKSVLFLGEVDYSDMPLLYNGAVCSVNLSEYEGFPMTTVEAMACGTPAVCLKSPIFKEVAGEGAILIKDEDELKDELMELIKSSSYRKGWMEKGLRQSKKYTWDNHVKKLVNVYESAVYGS